MKKMQTYSARTVTELKQISENIGVLSQNFANIWLRLQIILATKK